MTEMNRREALMGAAKVALGIGVGAAALALPGCAGVALTPAQIAQLAQDAALVADTFKQELGVIAAIPGMPSAQVLEIQGWVGEMETLANAIGASVTAAGAVSLGQSFLAALDGNPMGSGGVLGTLAAFPLPAGLKTAVLATQALVPGIALIVGLATPAKAAPGGMSPQDARAALREIIRR